MGIAAIAILGFVKLSEQSAQNARSKELDNDFNVVASNVQMVLNSDCASLLPGATYTPGQSPAAQYTSFVVNNFPIASVGLPPVGTRVMTLNIANTLSTDIQAPIGNLHQDLVNFNISAQKFTSPSGTPGQGLIGNPTFSKNFSLTVWWDENTKKIIDCDRQQQVTISLSAPALNCFPAGQPMGLTWTASGAEGIQVSGGELGANPPALPLPNPFPSPVYAGTTSILPASGPNTYTALALGNSGQNASSSVTINAQTGCPANCSALQVPTFNITPTTGMPSGTPIQLNWTAPGATAVSISPTVGTVAVSGPTTIPAPSVITTYVLTSSNSCGTSAPVAVTVSPQSLCSCGNASACTGGVTTYQDSCGHNNCQCPAQGTCAPPAPSCAHGNVCCSGSTNTWTCPGVGEPCL